MVSLEFDYSPESDGPGCRQSACDCIGGAMDAIAVAISTISLAIEGKVEEPCKDIEKCIDKIIEALRQKFEGPLLSCEQCRTMAAQGLAGTIEYAIRCAHSTCDECLEVCSGGDDGKCCKNCGEDKVNCKCKAGQCVGEDKEEAEDKRKWVGWCNPLTEQVQVTREGSAGPGSPWYQVALAESELAAIELAQANCRKVEITRRFERPEFPAVGPFPSIHCSLGQYQSRDALNEIAQNVALANFVAAQAEFAEGLGGLGIGGLNVNNVGEMLVGLMNTFAAQPPALLQSVLPTVAEMLGCTLPAFTNSVTAIAGLGLVQKMTGADLDDFTLPYRYAANLACQQRWLDADKALGAFLANAISYDELQTLWQMHGYCPQNVPWTLQAARAKPIPLQLSMLRRRGLHTSTDYQNGMRELGYLDPEEAEKLFTLTEQVPTLNDITRLMVRDADDESVKHWQESDELFTKKYGGRLKQWAQFQGIPDEFFKLYWRAHWSIPSPTQLFEFYHRLRKDPKYGGEDQFLSDIKEALIQQDILPFWQDKYLAVSFRPIGRIDIRRAYNIGAVSDDELPNLYGQLGYSDETSETLAKFTRRLRAASLPNHRAVKLWQKSVIDRDSAVKRLLDDGISQADIDRALSEAEAGFLSSPYSAAYTRGDISQEAYVQTLITQGVSENGARRLANILSFKITNHPALKQYIAGTLDLADARSTMVDAGMNTQVIDRLITEADIAVDASFAVACQKGIKRRYLLGELDEGEAKSALQKSGTTQTRANRLVTNWQCEKSAVGKAIPAAKLCEWLARGVIDSPEFISRLTKIGYTYENASLMLQDCLTFVNEKRAREAEKLAKQQIDAQVKAARATEQANAKVARREAQLKAGREKQAKARINRQAQLLSAAAKLADKCDCTLDDSIGLVQSQVARLQTEFALTLDETLKTIILAVESWDGGDPLAFPVEVTALAEAAVSVPQNGSPASA